MRLADVALFAKRSGGEDFELVARGEAPSRAVEQGAAQWLQAHLDSGNEKTVTLARLDGGWWLVRGASEDATDAAGRRRCHLVLARLEAAPADELVGPLLLAAYQEGLPSWQLAGPQEIQVSPAHGTAPEAALALATGSPAYPVVAAPELASGALARVGLETVDFATLMPLAVPARLPGARGIVISRAPQARAGGAEWAAALDLRALARLPTSAARRAALAAATCGGPLPADLSDAEIAWLIDGKRPELRVAALAGASAALVRELLERDQLEPADVGAVAARLDLAGFARLARSRAGADLDGGVRALLDLAGAPPATPPAGWLAALRPVLAGACRESGFWRRWTQGMPPSLARWIATELAGLEGGALAAALAAPGGTPWPASSLRLIGPALGAAGTLDQAVSWGTRHLPGRAEALEALWANGTLREPLARWLRAELGSVGPTPPPPGDLSAAELAALLPLLHPAHVLRAALAWSERDRDEAVLLPLVLDALVRRDCAPLPAPDATAAARRPDWVAAVAALPGWEHWRGA